MKYLKLIVFTLVLAGFSACSDSEKENSNAEFHIELDNRERWVVNQATKDGIGNMTVIVEVFQSDSSKNYVELNESLELEFKTIFEKCDMTGEAHDQLHNYLFPLKRFFNQLKLEDQEKQKEAVKKIEGHLNSFETYFK